MADEMKRIREALREVRYLDGRTVEVYCDDLAPVLDTIDSLRSEVAALRELLSVWEKRLTTARIGGVVSEMTAVAGEMRDVLHGAAAVRKLEGG